DTGGAYDENPGRLYDRNLHSTYFQILCEFGAVGAVLFYWLGWGFWKRNVAIRTKEFGATRKATGIPRGLRGLALGLECGMVSYLATGALYNQIFNVHWFYSILTLNMLLHRFSRPPRPSLGPSN